MLLFCQEAKNDEVQLLITDEVSSKETLEFLKYIKRKPFPNNKGEAIRLIGLKNLAEKDKWYEIPLEFWDNFKIRPVTNGESEEFVLAGKVKDDKLEFPEATEIGTLFTVDEDVKDSVDEASTLFGTSSSSITDECEETDSLFSSKKREAPGGSSKEEEPKKKKKNNRLTEEDLKEMILEYANEEALSRITNKYSFMKTEDVLKEEVKDIKNWEKMQHRTILNMFMDIDEEKINEYLFGLKTVNNRVQIAIYTNLRNKKVVKAHFKLK